MSRSIRESSNSEFMSNGVSLIPSVPSAGDNVKVLYDGILSKSGATDVLARVGFGDSWQNTYDYRMVRSSTGFEATIPVSSSDSLNIAFKDCANNWDNNSGKNYSFDIIR